MTDPDNSGHASFLRRLRWPLRLTRAGMAAERLTRAFWPVWTLGLAAIAAVGLGGLETASVEVFWTACLALGFGFIAGLVRGARQMKWPTAAEALARLDATLPGRPIAALSDQQAIGAHDAASVRVWAAHRSRMIARALTARAPAPDLGLAKRDPFALRYVALTLVLVAGLFGSLERIWVLASGPGVSAPELASASWEGWAEPPAYTGKPDIYLSKQPAGALALAQGTKIVIRLYGPDDALAFSETLSGKNITPTRPASNIRSYEFVHAQAGQLIISGEGGRSWDIGLLPDTPPQISASAPMDRKADGTMSQPFKASDDFGITKGEARFELDLPALDRRFGLAVDGEPQPPLIFDLPRPGRGERKKIAAVLSEDASKHPWANLPVIMTLSVTDALGQTASSAPAKITLPGRRFFDPLAAGVAEMRRDLLWSRGNATRTVQILRAMTWQPEGFIKNERAYLLLRVAIKRLDASILQGGMSAPLRDELAEALWQVSVLLEDGGLQDAFERMQQAQERLTQAIRNGASDEEINKLMEALKDATDDYLKRLAEQAKDPNSDDELAQNQQGQSISGDQIQQMMDQIEKLMKEGRKAEAQAMLDQLNELMKNIQVTKQNGGQGGDKAMRDLQQTLRDQENLSDEAFDQQQGKGGQESEDLARRQQALADQLERQQDQLPDLPGDTDNKAQKSLDQAGRAMEDAEKALREGDLGRAIDRQAEAIEQLHEGLRDMGRSMAENRKDQSGSQDQDGLTQNSDRELPRDPLGRTQSQDGTSGTDGKLPEGPGATERTRNLLDEIRRRAGEQGRPKSERDYLGRLIGPF